MSALTQFNQNNLFIPLVSAGLILTFGLQMSANELADSIFWLRIVSFWHRIVSFWHQISQKSAIRDKENIDK